jgi:hypothetical protein
MLNASVTANAMCQYCTYRNDGWATLLKYDDTYQKLMNRDTDEMSNYGFHESWDELRDQIAP